MCWRTFLALKILRDFAGAKSLLANARRGLLTFKVGLDPQAVGAQEVSHSRGSVRLVPLYQGLRVSTGLVLLARTTPLGRLEIFASWE